MPHIHTQPNQHDITVSAWILRRENEEWKCLVHFHKKMDVLMQIGGHIELDENPWQSMAHELKEESGYALDEVDIFQYTNDQIAKTGNVGNVVHPVPFSMNTHDVGGEHYHSDLCYGFVAKSLPTAQIAADESSDLRWLTLGELQTAADTGDALQDVVRIYTFLVEHVDVLVQIPATQFSLLKPQNTGVTYKRGAADESRTTAI